LIKIVLFIIALINGGWMIFDGIYVLKNGKYFGPDIPGPWSKIVKKIGLNPFKLGVPFIILGLLWIVSFAFFALDYSFSWYSSLIIAVCTLWYMPIGTILSVISIVVLLLI